MSSLATAMLLLATSAAAFSLTPPRAALPSRHAAPAIRMMAEAPEETMPVPSAFLESRTTLLKDVSEYEAMYAKSINDPDAFWSEIANTFYWETPFTSVVDSNFAASKGKVQSSWFGGGKTNICYNALDRHVKDGFGNQIALLHEANDEGDEQQSWTYAQVLAEVERLANVLKSKGVKAGDRVSIFMPMVPQLPMAMLACARLGAVHSVVFGGFSAEALASRLIDAKSSVVITADGVMRGAKPSATRPRPPPALALLLSRLPFAPILTRRGSRALRHRCEGRRDHRVDDADRVDRRRDHAPRDRLPAADRQGGQGEGKAGRTA